MPTEGPDAGEPRAGAALTAEVPTCALREPVGEVRERARAAGWEMTVVVNAERIVLGRIRFDRVGEDSAQLVEAVMEEGPGTVRHDEPLEDLAARMREKHLPVVLVTTPEGRLSGIVRLADAERVLADRG